MNKSKSVIAIILATVLSIVNVCPVLAAEEAVVKSAATAVSEVEESEDIAVSGDSGNNQVDVDQREGSSDDSEDEASGDSSAFMEGNSDGGADRSGGSDASDGSNASQQTTADAEISNQADSEEMQEWFGCV